MSKEINFESALGFLVRRFHISKGEEWSAQMTWKIEKVLADETTTFLLSGQVHADQLDDLNAALESKTANTTVDLGEVTLVDVDVVRFLIELELEGVLLVHCPMYIREWISKEHDAGPATSNRRIHEQQQYP